MATIVGRNIRHIRKQSGYSQASLAKLARTSQSWICRIETGNENPTLGSVTRIARALRVDVADLLPSARLLHLALAEHVSDGATCFPGQSRLAAMCGISDRQVRSLLRELQARGLITVEHRPGQGRGRKSNVYRLELGNRQSATACPEGQAETGFRNPASGSQGATGSPGQGNRNSASACLDVQSELQFRNSASDCPEATGSPAQGNRKSATGNRNPISAETEEGNGRKEFKDTPLPPPVRGMPPAAKTDHEAVSTITRPQSPAWAR